jgi:3-oxoacyl-[acyl-carrier protein] reductase
VSEPEVRALVTGGSGALGGAICRRLAAAGHFVYVHANRNGGAAQDVAREIGAAGGQAQALCFDVTDADASRRALDGILEQAPIQILVNNAAIRDDVAFPGMSATQWQSVIDVALKGFYNVTQPLVLPMIHARWGRIVNISSVASLLGNRGQVNYAAAKGALNAATKALSLEVARRGVTVNAVAPGIIAGGMSGSVFDAASIETLVPMRRAGTVEEVSSLVAYLASDEAGYITGQVISVNGGMA